MNIKKIHLANIIIIFSLCLTYCKSSEKSNKTDTNKKVEFTLKTTPCFGTCPEFSLTIYSNNDVAFNGLSHTTLIGDFKKNLSKEDLSKIRSKIIEIDYYNLKLKNDFSVKDLPTKHFYANNGALENTILYYYPKNPDLDQLYDLILELIEDTNWKGDK